MWETWKAVPGFEGEYEASDQGRIRSLDRWIDYKSCLGSSVETKLKGRILRPGRSHTGRHTVNLRGVKSYSVHSLILLTFCGPPPEGMECLHRDDNPGDNRLCNLRYGTHSKNMQEIKHNKGRTTTKLLPDDVVAIRKMLWNVPDGQIGREFGVSRETIQGIKHGRIHTDV